MKILYYHQHFSTPQGSIGTRSYEMARRLLSHGHSVTIVCGSYELADTGLRNPFSRRQRRGTVDGIEVIEFRLPYRNADSLIKRSVTFVRFAFGSTVLALREEYDVLFATSTPLTAAIPGILARLLRRKPFVFEVRDLWPELPRAMGVLRNPLILKLLEFMEWAAYKAATSCIGLSPGIVDGIRRRAGNGKHVAFVPNGSDLHLFTSRPEVPDREQNDSQPALVAVFMGAHGLANGLDAVLDAAAELQRRKRAHIRVILVGDGKSKSALQDRAKNEELHNVEFMDPIPKSELQQFLRNVDVGLMTLANVPAFYFGTSPNKFFDYISCGLPVINNYPGWLAEMITEKGLGIAVPPEDAGAFADALEILADNVGERLEMGRRARCAAEEQFDREKLGARFVEQIELAAVRGAT